VSEQYGPRSIKSLSRRAHFLHGLGFAATIAAIPHRGRSQTNATLATLKFATVPNDPDTPLVYGLKAGIFAKYGIDLQISRLTNGGAVTAAVLSGAIDMGKSNITTLLDAHEKGLPVTLVAGVTVYYPREPIGGFILRKDSPIQTGADFNNQVVGVSALGDIGNVALRKWIDDHGGDWKSVKFIEVPPVVAAAAVEQGRVVAAECPEPMLSTAVESGKMRAGKTMFDALGTGILFGACMTTKGFSAEHASLVRAFARAWRESSSYTNAHHAETVDMMAEFTGMSATVIAKMPRTQAAEVLVPSQIQPVIDAAVKYGGLKQSFPATDLIDPNVR
jgi:NitT/TauT family transport system substrate-binding protein